MQDVSTRASLLRQIGGCPAWAAGVFLSLACALIYLAVRPPLFDNDGYRDRLYALEPTWFYNANPHHLLWNFIQALIATVAAWLGHPTTLPFQLVGILLSCATLFFFFALLRETSGSAVFAAAGALLVAFSPIFWQTALQNRVYALMFFALVLYLRVWNGEDGRPPSGLRLLAAGLLLIILTLLQQAAILLVPAAAIILVTGGTGRKAQWLVRGCVWGGSIIAVVLLLYLGMWASMAMDEQFFTWIRGYSVYIHPPGWFEVGFPMALIKSIIGISGILVQSAQIESFLQDNFSSNTIVAIYGAVGVLACAALGVAVWFGSLRRPLLQMIRTNTLFSMSLLSILFWSAFVFLWEPAESHYWLPALFPALVCLGVVLRQRAWHGLWVFVAIALPVSAWNGYFNHENDRLLSRNFPEPLLAAIHQRVGPRDIFMVLAQDGGLGGIDYDLLLTCLQYWPRNPAVAILNDFVWPAGSSRTWQKKLRDRIDATLDSGGHVFVAAHVLAPETYKGLSGAGDPFSTYVSTRYLTTEGLPFYHEVRQVFAPYKLKESGLSIGTDRYFLLQRD